MRYCTYCGMPMEDDDLFCTRCGRPAGEAPAGKPGESREETVALYAGDGDAAGYDDPAAYGAAGYGDTAAYGAAAGDDDPRGYGNTAPEYDPAGYGGYETYEDDDEGAVFSGNRNRTILIACAVIVVAVLGVLLTMLVRPGANREDESRGEQVAVYEEDENGAGGQNMSQGSVNPFSGENEASSSETGAGVLPAGNNGSAQQGGVNSGSAQQAGDNSHSAQQAGDGSGSAQQAGGNASGSDQQQAQASRDEEGAQEQEPTGWVVDEDGNEVYYPAEGEEYRDSDQTEVGGGYTGEDGAPDPQRDQDQTMQTQGAGETRQADDEQGQDELQGYSATGTDDSYILSESASRNYSRGELEALDNWTLQMAINEIYARHGRKFDTPEIREYFESKSWYRGTVEPAAFDGNEASYFNKYEMSNRELMAKIRAEREAAAGRTAGSGT